MRSKSILVACSIAIALQLFTPLASLAKLYTWIDRNGIVRRTYYPPPPDQVGKTAPVAPAKAISRQEVSSNTVELYVTSWCPYCKNAISYFKAKGVPVTVYDVEKDMEAAARKQALDGQGGVPFAMINGTPVHGYAPELYAQALR